MNTDNEQKAVVERPRCCGECARFTPFKEKPGKGCCDEWPCIIDKTWVCTPNIGRKRRDADARQKR